MVDVAERDGTFAPAFVEKLQQASSNNRILHKLWQYALHFAHQQKVGILYIKFAMASLIGPVAFVTDRKL